MVARAVVRSIWMRSRPTSRPCARMRPPRPCWPSSRPTRTATAWCPRPAPPSMAGRTGWAPPCWPRRPSCASRAITVPILAWLWSPGDDDLVACVRDEIDVTASSAVAARGADRGVARHRGSGPRPAQDRHRPGPQRGNRRRLAGTGRAGRPAAGQRHDAGDRGVVALRRGRRPEQRDQRRAAGGLRRGARGGGRSRAHPTACATSPTPRRPWPPRRRTTTWSAPGIAVYGVSPGGELGAPSTTGWLRR